MANISGESLFQVDEPVHHDEDLSMPPSPIGTPTSRQSRFAIPEKSTERMCRDLGGYFEPDDDDARIQSSLLYVWVEVEETLSEDPEVIERLADKGEFFANVKDEGEKRVIELLRDTAKKGSWLDLIENSTHITFLT
jgi:hypothetical protein